MKSRCRLYLITPPKLEPVSFGEMLKRALDGGDVATVQLRLKGAGDNEIRRAIESLMSIAQAAGAAFLINDRADLAAEFNADGVHIGQEDIRYAKARALVGANRIVGVTCHDSRHLAMEAAEVGADYVAFGAFFPTYTKEAKTQAHVDLLNWWSILMMVPCVAIGGITINNAKPLIEAGADFIAVSSGVWNYPDGPQAAVKAFNVLF
jgi:thiamine-phosphate pyrophosphorylase